MNKIINKKKILLKINNSDSTTVNVVSEIKKNDIEVLSKKREFSYPQLSIIEVIFFFMFLSGSIIACLSVVNDMKKEKVLLIKQEAVKVEQGFILEQEQRYLKEKNKKLESAINKIVLEVNKNRLDINKKTKEKEILSSAKAMFLMQRVSAEIKKQNETFKR
jgi:hypothetical protein